jgi:hypothetical protein
MFIDFRPNTIRPIKVEFEIVGSDIPAAFLQQWLTKEHTIGYQYITKLPSNMPGELANQLNAIDKAHNGLKQSNSTRNFIDFSPPIDIFLLFWHLIFSRKYDPKMNGTNCL